MNQPDRSGAATRANARVALVTCAEQPELTLDDRQLLAPLARLGITASPQAWDDDRADWARYDLVVLRSTWDYALRREAFLRWAAGVPRLLNPASVVAWNTDKRYLAVLAAAGVPVVPTGWLAPGDTWSPEPTGAYVIKPTVSAGSRDTSRYDLADPKQRLLAPAHVARLHASGRAVMVQPYLEGVDSAGETALVYLGGRYSHAIRKGPMLRPNQPPDPDEALHRRKHIEPRVPDPAELAAAERVLAAVPFPASELLYARVDLIPGTDGPVLLELELTEPSLYLSTALGAADRLAGAIADRA